MLIFFSFSFPKEIFGIKQDWGEIEYSKIDEASGLVVSRQNLNIFWTHNDSGDKNRIYAFNDKGKHVGVLYIKGIKGRDWEDIAIGPGPVKDKDYLYIGNIGDNLSQFNVKYIYRILEPTIDHNNIPFEKEIKEVDMISFEYEDGRCDAETLIVDPETNDIFILSKREDNIKIYILPYPQNTSKIITAKLIGNHDFYPEFEDFDIGRITAGDISKDGNELLIKSYINVFYFNRIENQSIDEIIVNNKSLLVNYDFEPQGEAICWHNEGFGYFTLSEEKNNIPAHLYFYPRLEGCMDNKAINFNPYASIPIRNCKY